MTLVHDAFAQLVTGPHSLHLPFIEGAVAHGRPVCFLIGGAMGYSSPVLQCPFVPLHSLEGARTQNSGTTAEPQLYSSISNRQFLKNTNIIVL